MAKITDDQIHKSYDIGKLIYEGKLSLKEGKNQLSKTGIKLSSGQDYIYAYSNLIQGKLYTRTMNAYGTRYFLQKIYEENGMKGLKKALLSLSQHIEYYEPTGRTVMKTQRLIYKEYFDLIKSNFSETIFPDEVDEVIKYPEGKLIKVNVNYYERSSAARQECIEHYGCSCAVCNMNFEDVYGSIGKDFIHVHHRTELATIGKVYSVDPINDLIPVCPNCHSMLHKRKPAFSISELKTILKEKAE